MRSHTYGTLAVVALAFASLAFAPLANAQTPAAPLSEHDHNADHPGASPEAKQGGMGMMGQGGMIGCPMMSQHGMMGQDGMKTGAAVPTAPGQDTFGAIQEIVQMLEADPKTDWSKVNLEALRQHLIDMNEVTLKAAESAKVIDGGLEITVTGEDWTLVAVQRFLLGQRL